MPPTAQKCRYCGATKRSEPEPGQKTNPEYCSGKCEALDNAQYATEEGAQEAVSPELHRAVEHLASLPEPESIIPGSLDDYIWNTEKYHRRYQPERLNWGDPLNQKELTQAGFRANRKPIPGDFDYIVPETEKNEKAQ